MHVIAWPHGRARACRSCLQHGGRLRRDECRRDRGQDVSQLRAGPRCRIYNAARHGRRGWRLGSRDRVGRCSWAAHFSVRPCHRANGGPRTPHRTVLRSEPSAGDSRPYPAPRTLRQSGRSAARKIFRRGATQLKLFISGGVVSLTDRLEDTQLTIEELRAAVVEAKARKTYVAGHAHNCDAMRNGLAAGIECFEHATMLDEATAAAIKAANAAVDPTMTVCNLMVNEWKAWGLDESVVPRMSGVEAKMIDAVRIARDAGLLIGSGSDMLGPGQNRRGLELVLKAKILGPMEAVVSATRNNAKIMRLDSKLGTLEQGKIADVIAVRGDPLSNPEIFDDPSRVVLVIKAGRVVKNLVAA